MIFVVNMIEIIDIFLKFFLLGIMLVILTINMYSRIFIFPDIFLDISHLYTFLLLNFCKVAF